MRALIAAAMDRSRTTLLLFLFLLLGGMAAYQVIPKESNPDVTIPMFTKSTCRFFRFYPLACPARCRSVS